jgi:hypothetical protein
LYGEKGGVVESAMKVIRMMGKNGETWKERRKQEKTRKNVVCSWVLLSIICMFIMRVGHLRNEVSRVGNSLSLSLSFSLGDLDQQRSLSVFRSIWSRLWPRIRCNKIGSLGESRRP